ncbi:MAG: hypothetical protein J2P41_00665 [Blastocatellia bacterium]|nr:hypothetical protein [Blastocatellia bacterium]
MIVDTGSYTLEGLLSLIDEFVAKIEGESGREAAVAFIDDVNKLIQKKVDEIERLEMNLTTKEEQIAADLSAKFFNELQGQGSGIAIAAAGALLGRLLGNAYKTELETRKNARTLTENMIRIARFWRAQNKAKAELN